MSSGRARWRALPLSLAAAIAAGTAFAQMPDPSAMSGIPRPDPQVAPGTLIARVIRGDFSHPMVNAEVQLDGPGGKRDARVRADGRATFEGLAPGGPYKLTSSSGGQTVESHEIEMPGEAGVKVMLVFKPDEKAALAEHDGQARADKALPAGTVVISVVDEDDKPLSGMEVTLAHGSAPAASADKPDLKQDPLVTDAHGEARYQLPAADPRFHDGFVASVKKEMRSAASQPFQLDPAAGMRLGLRAAAISHDGGALTINRKSHLVLEIKDEGVEVVENFFLENAAGIPVDPGKEGLVFLLPDAAQGAQPAGEAPPGFTVANGRAVLPGPIGAGETRLSIAFVLPMTEGSVELRQKMPVAMDELVGITSDFPGLQVHGDGLTTTQRELGGRKFNLIRGAAVAKDAELHVALVGLPHRSPLPRYLAVALAGLLVLWAAWAGFARGGQPSDEGVQLAEEKRHLLDELAALDRHRAGTSKAEAKHQRRAAEITDKLERVMRDLDERMD